jgi:hypothetical protein
LSAHFHGDLDLSVAALCLLATKFLRIGERDHRAREPRIIAVQCAALDCERLRERSFRSLSIVRDLIVEDALPTNPYASGGSFSRTVRACESTHSPLQDRFDRIAMETRFCSEAA